MQHQSNKSEDKGEGDWKGCEGQVTMPLGFTISLREDRAIICNVHLLNPTENCAWEWRKNESISLQALDFHLAQITAQAVTHLQVYSPSKCNVWLIRGQTLCPVVRCFTRALKWQESPETLGIYLVP